MDFFFNVKSPEPINLVLIYSEAAFPAESSHFCAQCVLTFQANNVTSSKSLNTEETKLFVTVG